MSLHYVIKPEDPAAHLFRISLTLAKPLALASPDGTVTLRMADWIPGSYMIRDFARNVVTIDARIGDHPLAICKIDKSGWQISLAGIDKAEGDLVVTYQVYAWELSVRAAHLDTLHGFFNGTSVFLTVQGGESEPCTVAIQRPEGALFQQWRVATAMKARSTDSGGFGLYEAADYDELIDHPVEMGTFERVEFSACGVPHEIILTGNYRTDTETLKTDLTRICESQIRFFGEPAPMTRFVFLVMVVGDGYGGLEHRESTSLLVTRENLPHPRSSAAQPPRNESKYIDFLGLCSHEYFHCWNVKRIKPAVFIPYPLDREVYTELLWAFEGITSYYDDLFLVRSGMISEGRYLQMLGETVTRVHRGSGRLKQSVAESSFDAWTRFYKQDENAPNAIVSYYAKGALVAFCLDMLIRQHSSGRYSLDDLMRKLWAAWQDTAKGVTQADFEQLAADLCGEPCDDFFAQAVFGCEELDLESAAVTAGLNVNWRCRKDWKDKGGVPPVQSAEPLQSPPVDAGVTTVEHASGLRIKNVYDGGAAQQCGIAAGDIVVAIDRLSVLGKTMDDALARHEPGEEVLVHVFRHGELHEFKLLCQAPPETACWLTVSDQGVLSGWLNDQDTPRP